MKTVNISKLRRVIFFWICLWSACEGASVPETTSEASSSQNATDFCAVAQSPNPFIQWLFNSKYLPILETFGKVKASFLKKINAAPLLCEMSKTIDASEITAEAQQRLKAKISEAIDSSGVTSEVQQTLKDNYQNAYQDATGAITSLQKGEIAEFLSQLHRLLAVIRASSSILSIYVPGLPSPVLFATIMDLLLVASNGYNSYKSGKSLKKIALSASPIIAANILENSKPMIEQLNGVPMYQWPESVRTYVSTNTASVLKRLEAYGISSENIERLREVCTKMVSKIMGDFDVSSKVPKIVEKLV